MGTSSGSKSSMLRSAWQTRERSSTPSPTDMVKEWRCDEYTISTEPDRLDLDVVHGFLTQSYWTEGISRDVVQRSIVHSLPFGLYKGQRQVGFARIITDRATFAYLADVFVLDEFRGQALGKWLIETIGTHPDLQDLRGGSSSSRTPTACTASSASTRHRPPRA